MIWCMQCGSENRPEQAIGVDEDGEPACAMHRGKPHKFEVATAAFIPQPAVQKKAEAVMDLATLKKCPGYNKDCTEMIGLRKELCPPCYSRRYYAKDHGAAPKKSSIRKAPKPSVKSSKEVNGVDGLLGTMSLDELKADLKQKLAYIEAVEAMLATRWTPVIKVGGD